MSQPTEDEELGLDSFLESPEDHGISLEQLSGLSELSGSLANLIQGEGADPYAADSASGALETDEDPDLIAPEVPLADEVVCPVSPLTILEAMLFVGHPDNEPLTNQKVAALMRGVRPDEVDQLVQELNAKYDQEGCVYHIKSFDTGYRMVLRDEWLPIQENFYGKIREAKLSQTAVDVLAIVAYHQPIERTEVEALRQGEPSGRILAQLVRRQLLCVEMTEEKPRRKLHRTTDRFLELFGIDSLDELPQSQDFDRR